jgi:amino-acid N-acetyltransferase
MDSLHRPTRDVLHALLTEAELPVADLAELALEHFLACGPRAAPDGVVGLELHAADALLRSLAVRPRARGRGLGQALVAAAERHARAQGVTRLYLLTTSAASFFARLGYVQVPREQAPPAIRATAQFANLCPTTSSFMTKALPANTPDAKLAREFRARLGAAPGALFFEVPFDVKQVFGRARVPVVVSIGSVTYQSTVSVYEGRYYIPLRKDRRTAAGVTTGDDLHVRLALDEAPRAVVLPDDLAAAVANTPGARTRWEQLALSHQREHVHALLDAKKPETRARRLAQIVAALLAIEPRPAQPRARRT